MAETQSQALTLNLLIDKHNNRVVFAEADPQFVDVLFSFLTLPIATIVRLLNKSSSLGAFDRLYKSVETLDPRFFQTAACKSMLLRPRSVAGARCQALAINIDDSDHGVYYKCSKSSFCSVSSICGVKCVCGGSLDEPITERKGKVLDGVFVKAEGRFMVSDDLKVRPVSMGESLGLLKRLGIEDASVLEKRVVEVRREEILTLLGRSLTSTTPLTDVFLQEPDIISVQDNSLMQAITNARINHKTATANSRKIDVKLYLSTESDKVVYAEAGEDFADLIFSFLTFPLGSVIKLLAKHSSVEPIDNLYNSVEILSSDFGFIKSDESKNMLLDPMLPPYFGCFHQLFNIGEVPVEKIKAGPCTACEYPVLGNACFHGMHFGVYSEMNPKQRNSSSEMGGYARGMKFMVTDELEVTALSPISGFHIINKLMVPINSLEQVKASLGEAEVAMEYVLPF